LFKKITTFIVFFVLPTTMVHAGGFVQVLGDFGGRNIIADFSQNTNNADLPAGKGVGVSMGWRVPLRDGESGSYSLHLATGYKYQSLSPVTTARVKWSHWASEVLLLHRPIRSNFGLGVGLQYHAGNILKFEGTWLNDDVGFAPAFGVSGLFEWSVVPEFSTQLRLSYLQYVATDTEISYPALTLGLGLTYFYSE